MKHLVAIMIFFSAVGCGENNETKGTAPLVATSEAEKSEQDGNLVGTIQKEDLTQAPYSNWFEPTYKSYEPSKQALAVINENIDDYDIKVFMGT